MKELIIILVLPLSVQAWFENYYACKAYNAGDIQGAQALYKKKVLENESDITALFNLATISAELKEYDEALSYYTALLEEKNISQKIKTEALCNRAHTFSLVHKYNDALQDLEAVLNDNPAHEKALHDKKVIETLKKEEEAQQQAQNNKQSQSSSSNEQQQEKQEQQEENKSGQAEQKQEQSSEKNSSSDQGQKEEKPNSNSQPQQDSTNPQEQGSQENSNSSSEKEESSAGEGKESDNFKDSHNKEHGEKEGQQSQNERNEQNKSQAMEQDTSGITDETKEEHESEGDGVDKVEGIKSGDKEGANEGSDKQKRGKDATDNHEQDSLLDDEKPVEKDFNKTDSKGQQKKEESLYATHYDDKDEGFQMSAYDTLLKQVEVASNRSGKQFLKRSLEKNARRKDGQKNW